MAVSRSMAWSPAGQPRERHAGMSLGISLPERPHLRAMAPENVDLDILLEDEHFLAINKPAGLVVHPGYRNTEGTLMNALLWHASGWKPGQRPSVVGRLDKLTSGVVLVAKTANAHAAFQRALSSAETRKEDPGDRVRPGQRRAGTD